MQKGSPVPDVDVSRWIIVYPVYLNARKTIQEGRKLSKVYCVDNPTCAELQQVCVKLGLESHIEADKCYSRNATLRGRLRVHLKDVQTKEPKNPEIPTRKSLLKKFGQDINKIRANAPTQATTATTSNAPSVGITGMPDGPRRKKKGKK